MRIVYARVSTRERNPNGQADVLQANGHERLFVEHASGKHKSRPELDRALAEPRAGDTLVVTKLDRLGRSLQHLLELSAALQERGVDLVVLQQGIVTSTPTGRLFFQIIGAIAEFERELNHERTVDGLAVARARGRTGGQKPKLTPCQVELVRKAYDARDCTVAQVASDFGVTRSTIYQALAQTEAAAR